MLGHASYCRPLLITTAAATSTKSLIVRIHKGLWRAVVASVHCLELQYCFVPELEVNHSLADPALYRGRGLPSISTFPLVTTRMALTSSHAATLRLCLLLTLSLCHAEAKAKSHVTYVTVQTCYNE